MDIKVTLDERGFLPDRYAKYADCAHLHAGVPTCSFPFEVTGVPAGTASLALTIVDFDAIPVCGFPWVHWCACGIDGSLVEAGRLTVPEDASNRQALGMAQGRNSSASRLARSTDPLVIDRYNGPQPPDGTHDYTLTVYALDDEVRLAEGFWMNELLHAMRGHVLAQATVELPARS